MVNTVEKNRFPERNSNEQLIHMPQWYLFLEMRGGGKLVSSLRKTGILVINMLICKIWNIMNFQINNLARLCITRMLNFATS